MKKRPQALVCFLLVIVTLFTLAGCGEDNDKDPVGTTPPPPNQGTVEGDPYANFPEQVGVRDYDMVPFRIATVKTEPSSFFVLQAPEEYTSYPVSDSMFTRDLSMSGTYGIDIQYLVYDNEAAMRDALANSIMGELHEAEMITGSLSESLLSLSAGGNLYNIHNLPTVSMDHPWWASYFADGVTYKNRLYYGASMAVGAGYFATVYSMICNLRLAQDVTLEDGTEMDMFALVENGDWTLETMIDIITDYSTNLDGNDEFSVYTDRMAYAHVRSGVTAAAHYVAAGGVYSKVNRDGKLEVDLANDQVIDLVEKLAYMFDIIEDNYDHDAFFKEGKQEEAFLGDRALFFGNSMSYVNRVKEMKSDYAIIPCPKADTQQEEYFASINTWTAGFVGIPADIEEAEYVGYALEILGWNSYYRVKPAVYDETLCLRLAKDPRQIAIMDEIYSNLYIDINFIQDFGTSATVLNNSIMNASQSYATQISACKDAITIFVNKFEKDNA